MAHCRFASLMVMVCIAPSAFAADCNTSIVSIPDMGAATPYPSQITIAGRAGVVSTVSVDIAGFSHSSADDVGIVLVSPSGNALLLQTGASNTFISNVSYTLIDSAPTQLPDVGQFASGSYRPAGYYAGDSFPAPGPLLAYSHPGPVSRYSATFASTFAGVNPNGTWKLYVVDFSPGDAGSIQGGWCLTLGLDTDRIFWNGFET